MMLYAEYLTSMKFFKAGTWFVKIIIPIILFLIYFFYYDTRHNVDGLWIYAGWNVLLFWQLFSKHVNNVKDRYELHKRIESLKKVTSGIMPEESYEAEAEKERI